MYINLHAQSPSLSYDQVRLRDEVLYAPNLPTSISRISNKTLANPNRLLFASLSPIEKGFFTGVFGTRVTHQFILELHDRWHNKGEQATCKWLLKELQKRAGFSNLQPRDLSFLCQHRMNLDSWQVKKILDGSYDYFEELKNEYAYLLEKSEFEQTTPVGLHITEEGIIQKSKRPYTLASAGSEVEIGTNDEHVTIIPVLGGIHSLGIGNPETDDLLNHSVGDIDLATLKSRIRQLKGEEPFINGALSRWQHRPFYITFAQHFFNTLCGHARSFTPAASLLFDQRRGMDLGMLSGCLDIWRELLSLTPQLTDTGAPRILIDVHHMSAAARHAYYKRIIYPYNKENKENPIPVIASHAGYAATDYLESLIERSQRGNEESHSSSNGFLSWGINLTDEDVLQIVSSKGLLGLSLDYHMLGGRSGNWFNRLPFEPLIRKRALSLFRRTLCQFVKIPFEYNVPEPHSIWKRLAIGNGIDGSWQTTPSDASVLKPETLENDLTKILEEMKREEPMWFGSYHPQNLARMICFTNTYDFVKKHY